MSDIPYFVMRRASQSQTALTNNPKTLPAQGAPTGHSDLTHRSSKGRPSPQHHERGVQSNDGGLFVSLCDWVYKTANSCR